MPKNKIGTKPAFRTKYLWKKQQIQRGRSGTRHLVSSSKFVITTFYTTKSATRKASMRHPSLIEKIDPIVSFEAYPVYGEYWRISSWAPMTLRESVFPKWTQGMCFVMIQILSQFVHLALFCQVSSYSQWTQATSAPRHFLRLAMKAKLSTIDWSLITLLSSSSCQGLLWFCVQSFG